MTLNKIARFNKIPKFDLTGKELKVETVSRSDVKNSEKEIEYEGKIIELCKYRSLRINVIVNSFANIVGMLTAVQL